MITVTKQQVDRATKQLEEVSDEKIIDNIKKLDLNLHTLRSPRITILALAEYRKVKATRDLLIAVLRIRSGFTLSPKIK